MKSFTRKFSPIALALMLALSLLAGCGNGGGSSSAPAASGDAPASSDTAAPASAAGEVYKVGFVTDQPVDNAEWLQNLVAGLEAYAAENSDVEVNVVEGTDIQEFEPKIRTLAESGYDLIITMYGDMTEQTISVAADYPDIKFGSMDGHIENIDQYANIQEFGLDRLETGYLAGVVAATMTQSGKVGIVAGNDEPVINEIVAGWQQGVASVSADIEDILMYAGTFSDPTIGKEQGLALVDRGCDVIAAAAGGTGVGTAQAAADTGTLFVAWDTHYPEVFTGEQLELGSAVNDFGQMVVHFIRETRDGNFTPGRRVEYGMATGACSFELTDDSPISDDARAALEAAMADIKAGNVTLSREMLHK